jgi:catechol 2,3-dioxygenase-like lactoylglutathione lyase family enzyme
MDADPPFAPPAAILETALYAEDLEAAATFYGDVLGLERVAAVRDRHVFFRCGPGMLLIFNPHATVHASEDPALPVPTHGGHGRGHVAFAAEGAALDALRARLEAAGVEIEADFRWPNGARSVYVRDPEGNSVEFAESRLWGF